MRQNTWLLEIHKKGGATAVFGPSVERQDGWMAEGAWTGEFSREGLLTSRFRCGSGVLRVAGGWLVLPPSHCIESAYCFLTRWSVVVSNSLHAIIARCPEALPFDLGAVRQKVATSVEGRHAYPRELYRSSEGNVMLRFSFNKVFISDDGAITETNDASFAIGGFATFRDYERHLSDTVSDVVQNARDGKRKSPYREIITTCSSGYDSAACAALAKGLGARTALTLVAGRGGSTDTGKPVADALGLQCHEFERFGQGLEEPMANGRDCLLSAEYLEAKHEDFLATASTSEDLFFADFEPYLAGAIVLTGFHGDYMWAMGSPSGNETRRGDSSGTGLDEFRKRVGFVNVPVPFIGSQFASDVARISGSEAMNPWSVGGDYNRPIPRRMAEEAGVPRSAFGSRKLAGSILLKNTTNLRNNAFMRLVGEYKAAGENTDVGVQL